MSLVEVMVAVTVTVLVLGVALSFAARLQQWDRRHRGHLPRNEQLSRLAETLRTDVRRAEDLALPTPQELVATTTGHGHIRYQLTAEGCRRTVEATDATPEAAELFAIGPTGTWELDRNTTGHLPLASISIKPTAEPDAATGNLTLNVLAAIGADRPPKAEPSPASTEVPPTTSP